MKDLLKKFDAEFPILTRQTDVDKILVLVRFWLAKELDQLENNSNQNPNTNDNR